MKAPIFIIGYPRSGTSFVGKLLAQFTGYPSHGESHTLTLLQELHHQINIYKNRGDFTGKELIKSLDLQDLINKNNRFFRNFYLQAYGSRCFIDKTPGAVACHGWRVVKQVFPSAVFVACIRSPVEVYESVSLKFKHRSDKPNSGTVPLDVAQGWVAAMRGIESLSKSEFADDLHVVQQLELRSNPRDSVERLFDFVGISNDKISPALDMCSVSREDVLTSNIDRQEYKTLEQSLLGNDEANAFRSVCEQTCLAWNISL